MTTESDNAGSVLNMPLCIKTAATLHPVMREYCKWRATQPGDVLDRRMQTARKLASSRTSEATLLTDVVTFVLHSRKIQALVFLAAIVTSFGVGNECAQADAYGHVSVSAVRLRIEMSAPQPDSGTSIANLTLTLLHGGCRVLSMPFVSSASGSNVLKQTSGDWLEVAQEPVPGQWAQGDLARVMRMDGFILSLTLNGSESDLTSSVSLPEANVTQAASAQPSVVSVPDVRFELQGLVRSTSEPNTSAPAEWLRIGASDLFFTRFGIAFLPKFSPGCFRRAVTASDGGGVQLEYAFDHRMPWPMVFEIVGDVVLALSLAGMPLFMRTRFRSLVKATMTVMCASLAVICAVAFLGYLILSLSREAISAAAGMAFWTTLSVYLRFFPAHFADALLAVSFGNVLTGLFKYFVLLRAPDAGFLTVTNVEPDGVRATVLASAGLILYAMRRRLLRRAVNDIQSDRDAYDAVWETVVKRSDRGFNPANIRRATYGPDDSDSGGGDSTIVLLERLETLSKCVTACCPPAAEVRQFHRRQKPAPRPGDVARPRAFSSFPASPFGEGQAGFGEEAATEERQLPVSAACGPEYKLQARLSMSTFSSSVRKLSVLAHEAAALSRGWTAENERLHRGVSLENLGLLAARPTKVDSRRLIKSLDQLYAQALGAAALLQPRCRAWATAAGASMSARLGRGPPMGDVSRVMNTSLDSDAYGSGGFGEQELQWWSQWRHLKPVPRAIEKALVCYDGDVSRLVDICRMRIVCKDLAGMNACLQAAAADKDVRIVQLKNWMRQESQENGGFRALVLNVTLNGEAASVVGVENHVCEIQILLKTIAYSQVQRDVESHARYLAFRSCRRRPGLLDALFKRLRFLPRAVGRYSTRHQKRTQVMDSIQVDQASLLPSDTCPAAPSVDVADMCDNTTDKASQDVANATISRPPAGLGDASCLEVVVQAGPNPTFNADEVTQCEPVTLLTKFTESMSSPFVSNDEQASTLTCSTVAQSVSAESENSPFVAVIVDHRKSNHRDSEMQPSISEESTLSPRQWAFPSSPPFSPLCSHRALPISPVGTHRAPQNGAQIFDVFPKSSSDEPSLMEAEDPGPLSVASLSRDLASSHNMRRLVVKRRSSGNIQKLGQQHIKIDSVGRTANPSSACNSPESEKANRAEAGEGDETSGVVFSVFLWSTLKGHGGMDVAAPRVREAILQSSTSSAWFTSKPVAAAYSRPIFQFASILVALLHVLRELIPGSYAVSEAGRFPPAQAARIRYFATRGGTAGRDARLSAFGLLQNGCRLPTADIQSFEGGMWTGFTKSVVANGYYFETPREFASTESDPTQWIVEILPPSAANNVSEANGRRNGEFINGSNLSYRREASGGGNASMIAPDSAALQNSTFNTSSEWVAVSASVWTIGSSGRVEVYPSLSFSITTMRGAMIRIDHRPPWGWMLQYIAAPAIITTALFGAGIAGFLRQENLAHPILLVGYASAALFLSLATANLTDQVGRMRQALEAGLALLPVTVLALGLAAPEGRFWFALLIVVPAYYVAALGKCLWVYERRLDLTAELLESQGTLLLFYIAILFSFRYWVLRQSRRMTLADRAQYDRTWEALISSAHSRPGIEAVRMISDELQTCCSDAKAQFNRQTRLAVSMPESNTWQMSNASMDTLCVDSTGSSKFALSKLKMTGSSFFGSPNASRSLRPRLSSQRLTIPGRVNVTFYGLAGELDPSRPVDSLSQLFVQAAFVNPLLRRKVQLWAAASNGLFPVDRHTLPEVQRQDPALRAETDEPFVRWVEASGKAELARKIKWAKIKSLRRSAEKVVRAYRQDVSLLLDVCRQSIIFENLDDLAQCLRTIRDDADVQLVRVKNRLDPSFDSATTAGYRDVAINMRLITDETKELGVETHVCEVQLILKAFALLKNDEGHKRYVRFRDLRGE